MCACRIDRPGRLLRHLVRELNWVPGICTSLIVLVPPCPSSWSGDSFAWAGARRSGLVGAGTLTLYCLGARWLIGALRTMASAADRSACVDLHKDDGGDGSEGGATDLPSIGTAGMEADSLIDTA